jgi:hypothetical protein
MYYKNIGSANNPQFILENDSLLYIQDVSNFNPALVDIDNDSDLDLFIGGGIYYPSNITSGRLGFYRNDGNPEVFNFTLVTNFFDSIDVGYQSRPTFIDIDADNDYDMFIGEGDGNINYYRNIGTPQVCNFILEDSNFAGISIQGYRTYPGFGDVDNDGDYDLFIGTGEKESGENNGGHIYYYENIGDSANFSFNYICSNYLALDVGDGCGVGLACLYQEGVYDMFLGRGDGETFFYRNLGSPDSAFFIYDSTMFNDIWTTYLAKPAFCDIDNDGDQDLFLGREIMVSNTSIRFYRNVGFLGNPILVFESEISLNYWGTSSPALCDIDNDEDFDLFIGETAGTIGLFRNIGTPEHFYFELETMFYQGINVQWWANPTFCDIDGDSDYDLFVGDLSGNLFYYQNIGTPERAFFEFITQDFIDLYEYGQVLESDPEFVDIDSDGDFDLFVGSIDGGVIFYRNLTVENSMAPTVTIAISGNDIVLQWQAVAEADTYKVYYQSNPYFTPSGVPQAVVMPPDTSWVDENAVIQGKRYYRVVVEY